MSTSTIHEVTCSEIVDPGGLQTTVQDHPGRLGRQALGFFPRARWTSTPTASLSGPIPHRFEWAREQEGHAGGHPSNILDSSYPVGGILAYGDVLTMLGPDGNSSGGVAVIATIAEAAVWKVGQLRPDRASISFREIDLTQAAALDRHVEQVLDARHLEQK